MITKRTIAIIGEAEQPASALSGSNYRILLCSSDPSQNQLIIDDIKTSTPNFEIEALSCPMNASWEADAIVLATEGSHLFEVVEKIRPVANQKVVVKVGENLNGSLQALLPNSRISYVHDADDLNAVFGAHIEMF